MGNDNSHNSHRSSLQSSARYSNVSSLSTSSRGYASPNSVARSSVTSTESIPPHCQLVGEKALRRSLGRQATLVELASDKDGIHSNAKSQCSYWCTVCEHPRPFQTSSGWIKHEKERHEETIYICMPDGPTSNTEHGLICVLCGARNPDANHLEGHNIASCLSRPVSARTYTRLYQLQKHLKTHQVPNGFIPDHRWRRVGNKQAWACGFCGAYFAKAKDRFHHIAKQHYERGEHISKWDPSKVILGLLQQPSVHKAWTKRMKLEFPAGEIDLRWDKTPSRSLISMLELGVRGTKDGADLARAAFIQSDYYQSPFDSLYSAIIPIEGTGQEMEISRPGVQDSHRLDHDSLNSEKGKFSHRANPVMDNYPPPGCAHQSGHHLLQATNVRTGQHRGVLAQVPLLDPSQILHSDWPAKSDMSDPLYEIPSIAHPEQSAWLDPVLFGDDYASHCDLKVTGSPLSCVAAPPFGEYVGGQPMHALIGDLETARKLHQESLRLDSKGITWPSSQNKRLVSKFSPRRSVSPMDVDLDLESLGGVLGNEETILETQRNLMG